MTSTKTSCSVCHEPLTATTEAVCNGCGAPFHLNQRNDQPGKDCGDVWINEDHMALEFACSVCIASASPEIALDDVLDLGEASMATGYAPAELARAADAGEVRHRRTASGTYLFTRRDLVALAPVRR